MTKHTPTDTRYSLAAAAAGLVGAAGLAGALYLAGVPVPLAAVDFRA